MSKHKTSELTGPLLDWVVGLAERLNPGMFNPGVGASCVVGEDNHKRFYGPRLMWVDTGPLIDKYEIALTPDLGGDHWTAWATNPDDESDTRHMGEGKTAQIAICRAVVRSVFGDEVELPG